VFTNYGSSKCPAGSTTVYDTARLAAAFYTGQPGSGTGYLCLNPFPDYRNVAFDALNNPGAIIYQVEYETSDAGNSAFRSLFQYEVPCSVCQRPGGQASGFMVPMSYNCPANYEATYTGFLMCVSFGELQSCFNYFYFYAFRTQYYGYHKSEFVCMNNVAQVAGTVTDQNGGLVYMVEMGSSGLPRDDVFSGYALNKEGSCAICSACPPGSFGDGTGPCQQVHRFKF
jgi:hypothetical protein